MSKKYDTDKILAENTLSQVIGARIELRKNGSEFHACCPFHKEKTPSFTVVDHKGYGFYHCFGCGAGGNAINFIQDYHNVDFKEACEILGGKQIAPEYHVQPTQIQETASVYDDLILVPYDKAKHSPPPEPNQWFTCYNPKRAAEDPGKALPNYKPSMVFNYGNLFWVIRIDMPGGRKITPVVAVVRDKEGEEFWSHFPAPEPRPLYQQWRTKAKQILLVEGEKACDAANQILKGSGAIQAVTWCGGGKAWQKANWEPLTGKSVIIWPDADDPGIDTSKKVSEHLTNNLGCTVKIIDVSDRSGGWDAADALAEKWDLERFKSWAKEKTQPARDDGPPLDVYANMAEQQSEDPEEPDGQSEEQTDSKKENKDQDEKNKQISRSSDVLDGELPFRILGYNKSECYYLPNKSQQLYPLNPQAHNKNNFLWLAPIQWWEEKFPQRKGGADWESAANAMMRWSQRSGVFEPHEMLRGRGAWIDQGRAVMHLGKTVYCEGQEMDPREMDSEYVYEVMPDLGVRIIDKPATTKEANQLAMICKKLSWQNDLSGALLAGWCVVAPVSGILRWRPHIWITGPSGSGKSTVVYKIIGAVLGKMAIHVEGKTTEAGIRGQLMQDARPIIYDEAEGEDEASARRLQSIIDLARVASSGGRIMKGTQKGGSQSYSVRSCFCFSSINTSVKHFADESRISRLILVKDTSPGAEEYFDQLHTEILDTFTPEFSTRMLTRSLKNLETLQKNSEVFSRVAARKFKSSRIADQLGEILAGYYLCHSTGLIEFDDAKKWIDSQDWEEMTTADEKSDPERLIDRMCTYSLRVLSGHDYKNTTIGELILAAAGDSLEVDQDVAHAELKRWGIKVEFNDVLIANKSDPLANKVLKDSPWSSAWARPLREIPGAEALPVTHFTAGIKARATKLPLDIFTR